MTEIYIFYILFSLPILAYALKLLILHLLQWKRLVNYTAQIDKLPVSSIVFWIALAAGLGIYNELMIIRLHSSYFHLFAHFKNLSLLSCFLGLGVGYLLGNRSPLLAPMLMPFLAFEIITLHVLRFSPLQEFLQNPISEQLILGMNGSFDVIRNLLIIYPFIITVFFFNALCFIPLGQLISRLMMRRPALVAYSWNLLGSLAGILIFSLISYLWAPPIVWVVVSTIGIFMFVRRDKIFVSIALVSMIIMVFFLTLPPMSYDSEIYSPYQKLTVLKEPHSYPVIGTNNVYYQRVLDLRENNIQNNPELKKWSDYYGLPYLFKESPQHVLIVGSGTGNDVASALRHSAGTVDAVEIDPAILWLGKTLNLEKPYQAPNVRIHLNDARAFIRQTQERYDLIVYGLLDSHTLLSNKSGGIRLDSYVYTVEGLRDARKKLKDDGIICLTFSIMQPELARKIFLMLEDAFDGQKPFVYQAVYDGGYAFIAGNDLSQKPPSDFSTLEDITSQVDDTEIKADQSTDDWPFLYMPVKKYPWTYMIIITLLLVFSVVFIRMLAPGTVNEFSLPCFFLGAGFMLVETKGITELALVYGSTWIVISIVITCILIMAFLANLLAMRNLRFSPAVTYGCLFLTLIFGYFLTFLSMENLPFWITQMIIPVALTLPLFFSGLAFSLELKKSTPIAIALSSNLLGAMFGGLLEYNSMYFGFRFLYILAIVMYVLAFVGTNRNRL